MSQENVEIVRRGVEALTRGDWEAAEFDSAIQWIEMPSLGPDPSSYSGVEEMRGALQSWFGMWSEYRSEVERYVDRGDEIVVLSREHGKAALTGIEVDRELAQLATVKGGKIVRVRLYGSWDEGLEAAGLSE
jgi:ketosteroid isomerase-like protein